MGFVVFFFLIHCKAWWLYELNGVTHPNMHRSSQSVIWLPQCAGAPSCHTVCFLYVRSVVVFLGPRHHSWFSQIKTLSLPSCSLLTNSHDAVFSNPHDSFGLICCSFPHPAPHLLPTNGLMAQPPLRQSCLLIGSGSLSANPVGGKIPNNTLYQ